MYAKNVLESLWIMITNTIYKMFLVARRESLESDYTKTRHKLGCVIVYRGRVISFGHNSNSKTSPLQKEYNHFRFDSDTPHKLHAEVSALSKLLNCKNLSLDFSKVSVVVYREKQDGSTGMARPCESCMRLIKDLGIRNIYYTTDDGYCHEELNS